MPGNPVATLYVGNLDERVDERILYEIMVQAGPVLDVYIPRDKDTKRHKGYGFAEYRSEESAQYAVKLFSGLVSLYDKLLRFAISGQDKLSPGKSSQHKSDNQVIQEGTTTDGSDDPSRPQVRGDYATSIVPPMHYPPISANSYFQPTHEHFSTLSYAQDHNSRLLALGQFGLRAQVPVRRHGYVNPSY